ncbi:hypothetical protein O6H91_21G004100 [Diphasiastrum complanatum]|uniref:Uncharacterized protein n=1 Tax=Diphasiastrum complanatum TaxID=34168 RepID=A0ACC2AH94_DIPCM|nr:hypothetical protein O6H91_21G004100 [Diphasiastrum complanatum]
MANIAVNKDEYVSTGSKLSVPKGILQKDRTKTRYQRLHQHNDRHKLQSEGILLGFNQIHQRLYSAFRNYYIVFLRPLNLQDQPIAIRIQTLFHVSTGHKSTVIQSQYSTKILPIQGLRSFQHIYRFHL